MTVDSRLATLRKTYPLPGADLQTTAASKVTRREENLKPNVPIEMRHFVFRTRTDMQTPGGVFLVDTLFPRTLTGQTDLSSVDEGSADLLYGLVRAIQPRVVLETGTHKGRSTRALVTALRDNYLVEIMPYAYSSYIEPARGHCWTIDAEDHRIVASGAIPEDAREFVTPVIGWTPDVFQQDPLGTLEGIEFAFLDGDHTAAGLEAELEYVDLHRARECWVAIDNSRDEAWAGVHRTLYGYTKHPRISLPTCTGMDLIWMHDPPAPVSGRNGQAPGGEG